MGELALRASNPAILQSHAAFQPYGILVVTIPRGNSNELGAGSRGTRPGRAVRPRSDGRAAGALQRSAERVGGGTPALRAARCALPCAAAHDRRRSRQLSARHGEQRGRPAAGRRGDVCRVADAARQSRVGSAHVRVWPTSCGSTCPRVAPRRCARRWSASSLPTTSSSTRTDAWTPLVGPRRATGGAGAAGSRRRVDGRCAAVCASRAALRRCTAARGRREPQRRERLLALWAAGRGREAVGALPRRGSRAGRDGRRSNVLRVEAGIPWYGRDMDESMLVSEVGIESAISYQKGCYLGQEVVERIAARGQVHRKLLGSAVRRQAGAAAGSEADARRQAGWLDHQRGLVAGPRRGDCAGIRAARALGGRKRGARDLVGGRDVGTRGGVAVLFDSVENRLPRMTRSSFVRRFVEERHGESVGQAIRM